MNNTTSGLNQLISVSPMVINGDTVNSVDARGLHLFLEVGSRFNDWIERRISEYGFVINSDYSIMSKNVTAAGAPRKDYFITVDMAKELSMVERNVKGKEARMYFIAMEKKAKGRNPTAPSRLSESIEAQMIAVKYAAEILMVSDISRAQMVYKTMEINGLPTGMLPAYVENVRVTFSATDLLKKNECGMGVRAFNKLMIEYGYLEVKTRTSTKHKDKIKKFNSLTDAGLVYGQNNSSPSNPNEVQPRYFEDTFMDLFCIVSVGAL